MNDRTKLTVEPFNDAVLFYIFLILLALKYVGIIEVSWWVVFFPLYIAPIITVFLLFFLFVVIVIAGMITVFLEIIN